MTKLKQCARPIQNVERKLEMITTMNMLTDDGMKRNNRFLDKKLNSLN